MLRPIVQTRASKIKSKSHQSRVNSRRWDKAPRWVQGRLSPQALSTYLVFLHLIQGNSKRIPIRLLASRRRVSQKTIYNHVIEMIDAKVMRVMRFKIERCRNTPNLYILLDMDGGDLNLASEKNCREKRVQNLKPSTSHAASARESNNSPAVRKLFEQNGRLWKLLRKVRDAKRGKHQLHAAEDRCRRAMMANVGVYTGPKTPDPTPEEIRAFWERQAKHKAESQRKMGVA